MGTSRMRILVTIIEMAKPFPFEEEVARTDKAEKYKPINEVDEIVPLMTSSSQTSQS